MAKHRITAKMELDDQRFRRGLKGAKSATERFTAGIKRMAGMMAGAFAIGSIVRFGKEVVKTNAQFEQSMAGVRAITKATDVQFAALEKSAKDLGRTTMFKASEVAKLQTEYAKIGFTTKEILAASDATLQLATATESDLAAAAETAGATIRAMGLQAEDTQMVVDIMAESFTSSALNLERWGDAMKYAAPIARAAGVDIQTVASMMSILADAGIHGSMAGTALKKIFSELSDDGRPLADRLKELADKGITLADANDEVGERAKAALLVLTSQNEKIGELTKQYQNAAGAAREMAEVKMNTLQSSVTMLSSAWEGLQLKISASNGVLKQFVDKLTAVIQHTAGVSKEMAQEIKNLEAHINYMRVAGESYSHLMTSRENEIALIDQLRGVLQLEADEREYIIGRINQRYDDFAEEQRKRAEEEKKRQDEELARLQAINAEVGKRSAYANLTPLAPVSAPTSLSTARPTISSDRGESGLMGKASWAQGLPDVTWYEEQETAVNNLESTFTSAFATIGSAIGSTFADGEKGFDSFAKTAMQAIAQVISALAAEAIAGTLASTAATSGPLGPILAPAAAAAMAGLFAALVPSFADGGIISGPTMGLMGEYPGARSNPEVIAPLSKLQDMMGGRMQLEAVIRGQDLYLLNKKYGERLSNNG